LEYSREDATIYSIWSRGRLIGHTDLGFVYGEHGIRMGWFQPNELGEKFMPRATGVAPALRASRDAGRDVLRDPDIASAFDHERALELELRGPNGKAVETEHIAIIDIEYLLSIPDPVEVYDYVEPFNLNEESMFDRHGLEEAGSSDDDWDEGWQEESEFPRYQIQVYLVDYNAIPWPEP
jgi:hypothetical protein